MSSNALVGSGFRRLQRSRPFIWTSRVPLFYRILIANVAIIALGAAGGTAITLAIGRRASEDALIPLIVTFSTIGIGLSLLVNVAVLRAAFRPLATLNRTALAVQAGDRDARAKLKPSSDPEMMQLANALNATLDELAEDRNRLRDLASQVIRAQEDERRRVSRELHDDTAQILFAQILRLGALKAFEDPAIQQTAAALEHSTVAALEGVRRLALELRPPALDDLGLADALAELCQRFRDNTSLAIDLQVHGMRSRLDPETELVLYRIAQEALTNVAKHANATRINVVLERRPHEVHLLITDNGVGFDRASFQPGDGVGLGLGLFGMEERAALLGGSVHITSSRGAGTEIRALVPLPGGSKQQ